MALSPKYKKTYCLILLIFVICCRPEDGEEGIKGLDNLTNVIFEPPGANCENGGLKIEVGLDSNSSGVLEDDEINSFKFVCNGEEGVSTLASYATEEPGDNCESGGIKVSFGLDLNDNGILDNEEISSSTFICNGNKASNLLSNVKSIVPNDDCISGGTQVDYGLDINENNTLDPEEVTSSAYICNGEEGITSLIKISDLIDNSDCENGGITISSGKDSNYDGNLSEDEVTEIRNICHGSEGTVNEELRLLIHSNFSGATGTFGGSSNTYPALMDFDIRNWSRAYSVQLSSYLKSDNHVNDAILELYDDRYNAVIGTISTNSTAYVQVVSDNLIDHFPEYSTELVLRLYSSNTTNDNVWISRKTELIIKQTN